jgi:phospholipase/carboxylesterase
LILGAFAIAQPNPDGELKELAGFKYVERVENASVDDKNLPLVIGLHWSGATPNSFAADISGFEKPVRMLLVQGAYPHPDGGYSFYVQSPVSYYDMAADEKMSILLQEAEKLSKFIKAAANLYSPKKKPVIIGASQGGDLSYVTAIRYGSLISGAFPLLATFDERILRNNATRKRQAPIFAFHGTDDPIVPIATVEHHIKALTASGYNARLRSYSGIKHDIPKSMKSDYLREVGKLLF